VDLIYGLEGQDFRSWQASVDEVIRLGPPTVCAYALTLRPRTGFAARGYQILDGAEQYAKYDYANDALKNSGYTQETNVRWVRGPDGGYIQKQNHWALEAIVGLGAGARGYLWECDYRNGYSVRHRMRALRDYLESVDRYGHGRTDGFLMDNDERRRKAVILGLIDLDRFAYRDRFGAWPEDHFHDELKMLSDLELITDHAGRLKFTALGIRHRDLLVQQFFSPRVQQLLESFSYDE
jgi:oxygen-independent coproporphyrinogen-3 oxidase